MVGLATIKDAFCVADRVLHERRNRPDCHVWIHAAIRRMEGAIGCRTHDLIRTFSTWMDAE